MSATNFAKSLAYVLQEEGGFVNDPRDPGGATNKGVTQAVYDDWRHRHAKPKQSVKNIADDEVSAIYRSNYWAAIRGDDLPAGLDYAVFDFAVNSGTGRAARFLQACVGAVPDGVIGPRTIGEIGDAALVANELCNRREAFLEGLPTYKTFGRGWSARVARVRQRAGEMA